MTASACHARLAVRARRDRRHSVPPDVVHDYSRFVLVPVRARDHRHDLSLAEPATH